MFLSGGSFVRARMASSAARVFEATADGRRPRLLHLRRALEQQVPCFQEPLPTPVLDAKGNHPLLVIIAFSSNSSVVYEHETAQMHYRGVRLC